MKRGASSPTAAKVMRFRARGPGGAKTLQLEDDGTVERLVALIKAEMGVDEFTVKTGYPPAPLDLTALDTSLKDLGLNGATITVDPVEKPVTKAAVEPAKESKPAFKPKRVEVDETVVEWPEAGGCLGRVIAVETYRPLLTKSPQS